MKQKLSRYESQMYKMLLKKVDKIAAENGTNRENYIAAAIFYYIAKDRKNMTSEKIAEFFMIVLGTLFSLLLLTVILKLWGLL